MSQAHLELLRQAAEMAEEGKFGESIRAARREYEQLPAGLAVFVKCVLEAYRDDPGMIDEFRQMRDLVTQLLIVAYRDALRDHPVVANALMNSLVSHYPGVPESCLAPQLCTLAGAALAFREVVGSTNRNMLWQHASRTFLAYNEFINALLGFLIPCLRPARGRGPQAAVFSAPYQSRVDQLVALTGGEEGAFFLLCRLAKPPVRNAIAHGDCWLDPDAAKVRYVVGRKDRRQEEMELADFLVLTTMGTHLVEPYLAAIGTLAVVEAGAPSVQSLLPQHLVRVFNAGRCG